MKTIHKEIPFDDLLHQFNDAIRALPMSESKHWLDLLRYAIQTEDKPWTRRLLQQALNFTNELQTVLTSKPVNSLDPALLLPAKKNLNALVVTAQTHTFGVIGTQFILNALGGFLSIIMGCIGAVLGMCIGLIRGIWYLSPLKHMGLGMLTLGSLFGMAGNRGLKKLKDPLFRQVKFALDGLETTFQTIVKRQFPEFDHYKEQAKNYLMANYFDNQPIAFEAFLVNRVKYAFKTQRAEFFDASMQGLFGHHGYLCVEINGKLLGIELTPYPTDLKIPAVQSENRETTGAQILEMYTFHLALLPLRNLMDPVYLLKEFKAADRGDCFFHLDQTLSVANEPPRKQVTRFFQESQRGMLAYLVTEKLSPWPPVFEFK